MTRRILVLDAALMVLLVMGISRLRQDWLAFDPAHQVSAIQPKPESFPAIPAGAISNTTALEDWTEIPTRNPFSFDRTDIAIIAPKEVPKPSGPKPILFGTMSLGADRIAMLAPGQPGNRVGKPVKSGETIDGWTVVQIETKSVVVEANGNRETIIMNDPTAQVPRDTTRTVATPAAAPAAPPVIAVPASTAPSPSAPATTAAPGQKRTRIMQTPFGPKVVEEDPQ